MAKVSPLQIVAFAVAASAAACSVDVRGSEVSAREEKRFTVSSAEPVELKLKTFDGTLVVRSWDKNEVLVEIERRHVESLARDLLPRCARVAWVQSQSAVNGSNDAADEEIRGRIWCP